MNLIFAKGKYPNFMNIRAYNLHNNSSDLMGLVQFINNNHNFNACLCKMKLYEEKTRYTSFHRTEKDYIFLDNYNNHPELKINEYFNKTLLLAFEDDKKCYCQTSKYELINSIQKNDNKNNKEYLDKITSLENQLENLRKKYENQLKKNEQDINSLNELKQENKKITKENSEQNDVKKELENEIQKLKEEKQHLENEENEQTQKLKEEIEQLNQTIKNENEKNKKISMDLKKKQKEEIEQLISQKERLYNETIKTFKKENKSLEEEKKKLNNKISKLKEGYEKEINKLNCEKENNKKNYENQNVKKLEEINILKNEKKELENEFNLKSNSLEQEKKSLAEEKENLINEIANLKDGYEKEINKLNIEKEETKKIYENENEQKLEEINILKNKHQKEIENYNNEISNLKDGYEKEINKLNSEKEDERKKYDDINEKKLEEINCLKNKHKEELEKLNKEKEDLKREGEIIANVDPGKLMTLKKLGLIKNMELKSNIIEIDSENRIKLNGSWKKDIIFENFYDLIVNIKSIKDIDKGWEIKMNEKGLENYKNYKNIKTIKIGAIGNSNKGKSFILSKLTTIPLPSGADVKTEGLSIKYPDLTEYQNRKIVLLDSAGLETPVLIEDIEEFVQDINKSQNNSNINAKNTNNENDIKNNHKIINNNRKKELDDICERAFKEKSREKIMTELFLQNYIMHNSDILLLVVGSLTYSEQKLINRIKTEMKNQNIKKPLYIVHNLMFLENVTQVEKYIENVLMKCATFRLEKAENIKVTKEIDKGYHYHEKNSDPVIYHLIMANEKSEAGEFYNPYTIKFIENSFQYLHKLKDFDIIETLKNRLITLSRDYFEKPILENQLCDNETIFKNKKFSLKEFDGENEDNNNDDDKSDDESEDKGDTKTGNNLCKNNHKKDIQLKCCLIDELGFSNFKGNGFVPKYNWFEKGDQISLRVEIPGNHTINSGKIRNVGEYTVIPISGEKKIDSIPKKIEDNWYTTREFGTFDFEIYLPTEKYCIKREKVKAVTKNGVAVFDYNLLKEEITNESTSFNEL